MYDDDDCTVYVFILLISHFASRVAAHFEQLILIAVRLARRCATLYILGSADLCRLDIVVTAAKRDRAALRPLFGAF